MKQRIASFLTIAGVAGLIYTGINYINNTESFAFLGADVVISQGDPKGMIIAAGVMCLGLLIQRIHL